MNERNVEAMEADLLVVFHDLGVCTDVWARCLCRGGYTGSVSLRLIAERLAGRAVLAPSALTYEQALEVSRDIHPVMTDSYKRDYTDEMCANLERVAKGEDAR